MHFHSPRSKSYQFNLTNEGIVRYVGHQSEKNDGKDELYSHTRSEGFGKEVRRRILVGTYVLTSG